MKLAAKVAAIEFVGDEVRLAVVKTGGRLPRVLELHSCRAKYDEHENRTEALVAAVKTVVGRMAAEPAAYVLCLSSFHSVVRSLTIPFRGRRRVTGAVRFELERYLAFPIEELVVDFFTVIEIEGQTDVLAIGVRREVLSEELGILNAAGIDPEGVNVDAVGLTGLWRDSRPAMKGLHAVLHVREVGSILAVVHSKAPAYFRHLAFTDDDLHRDPEAAAQEVQNSLRAFHAGWKAEGKVASLTVTGDGYAADARDRFAKVFDIPVTHEDLLGGLKGGREALRAFDRAEGQYEIEAPVSETEVGLAPWEMVSPAPAPWERASSEIVPLEPAPGEIVSSAPAVWEIAVPVETAALETAALETAALETAALETAAPEAVTPEAISPIVGTTVVQTTGRPCNGWEAAVGVAASAGGGVFGLNFRKDVLAPKNILSALIPQALLASSLIVLLLVGTAWYYYNSRSKTIEETQRLQVEVNALQQEVEALQNKGINVAAEVFSQPTLLDVLDEIAARMPDAKVSVTELQMETPDSLGPWIQIKGVVTDDAAWNDVLANLRQTTMFRVDEPEQSLVAGKMTFTIRARRNDAAAGTNASGNREKAGGQN